MKWIRKKCHYLAKRLLQSDRNVEPVYFDVLVVGAGPAGIAAAIRLRQLAVANNVPLSVCVIEKGYEVGSHILSGKIICDKHSFF